MQPANIVYMYTGIVCGLYVCGLSERECDCSFNCIFKFADMPYPFFLFPFTWPPNIEYFSGSRRIKQIEHPPTYQMDVQE